MDIIFDKIPATQVTPEFFGMKFENDKAKKLWNEWRKDKRIWEVSTYDTRIAGVDILLPSAVLKGHHGNEKNTRNAITDFIQYARAKGLKTNRMSE